ncbi:MAG: T9SS type A sorting domain-containing protein [Ignavibacteriae bacterium]|nr:T9SS type A sorting domain-containing protein [Ignavibacteriota bacterium]
MRKTVYKARLSVAALLAIFVADGALSQNIDTATIGYLMKVKLDNYGTMGRYAYKEGEAAALRAGKVGLEYPIGAPYEHLFGSGVWIGGLLDTSASGTSSPIRGVSVAYEGWSGPYHEFFPGITPDDRIWRGGVGIPKPAGWDAYWGSQLTYFPIADDERYMRYNDFSKGVTGHVPLRLEVIQRNYSWNSTYADAIMIVEYTIYNRGVRPVDSTYVGFFFEADVGPISAANFWTRNFTGYYKDSRTAYIHNPSDRGSTPAGVTHIDTTSEDPRLRYSFRWFAGNETPSNDAGKYALMSSGRINPDEFPRLSDSRFVFSFGPYSLRPYATSRESLRIAIAVLSGYDIRGNHLRSLQSNAGAALNIYRLQGIRLPKVPPSPPLRAEVGFRKVTLNWRWTPQDSIQSGFLNPEENWDTTNTVARRYPWRYAPPYPDSINPNRGGRNFEAYKIWRSENPDSPDQSFTLLRQVDTERDSFEYNTGLEYQYVDSNLVRGKTYVYSVTSKSIPNLVTVKIPGPGGGIIEREVPDSPLESSKQANKLRIDLPFSVSKKLGEVAVVPNPYRTDRDYTLESGGYEGLNSKWDENHRVVKFINLPEKCTIKVFSLAGDLVRTIDHDGGGGAFPTGDHNVTLLSESNRALASGIYIFTVESAFGVQTGKFVIIR